MLLLKTIIVSPRIDYIFVIKVAENARKTLIEYHAICIPTHAIWGEPNF